VEGRFHHPDYFVKIHYRAHRRFIGLQWMIRYQVERSVGADVSRTPPIHRPLPVILTPG